MGLTGPRTRSVAIGALIVGIGGGGMIGQLVLVRVLMVVSYGTELVIALVLACWLAFEAAGAWIGGRDACIRRARVLVPIGLVGYSFLLPAVIVAARFGATALGRYAPGQAMGLGQTLLTTVVVTLPTAIIHGALFPLSAHLLAGRGAGRATGRAYLIETTGSIAGGLVFVFALAPRLPDLQIACALVSVHLGLAAAALRAMTPSPTGASPGAGKGAVPALRTATAGLALAAAAAALLAPEATERLHDAAVREQWRTGNVVSYRNSPYGNIAVVERETEYTVYYDGRPIISLPYPDTARLRDYAWLAALSHPDPAHVLVLGGGLGGLLYYLLEHPLERLVYTEIDPLLPGIVRAIDSAIVRAEFGDPRTVVVPVDGRLYLTRTRQRYDLIILGDMEIETLQANRFFTLEFFRLARNSLSPGGVLALTLPGSMTYLGSELGALNACIYRTASSVFSSVHLIPGDRNVIVASDDALGVRPETALARLNERRIAGGMFTPGYLEYRLDPDRSDRFTATLSAIPVTLNRDFRPSGLAYGLRYWGRAFAPRMVAVLTLPPVATAAILLAGLLAGAVVLRRLLLRSPASPANRLSWTMGTSGAAAMTFDLFTLFAVQSLLGFIYQFTGLFAAALLGGAFAGGRITFARTHGRHRLTAVQTGRLLTVLDAALVLQLAAFTGYVHFLRAMMALPHGQVLSVATAVVIAVCSGALVGAQFPVAVSLMPWPWRESAGRIAGRLYTADLVGGCLAALGVSVLLFPHLGMPWTLLLLALVKLTSLAFLIVEPPGTRKPGARSGRGRLIHSGKGS